MYRLTPMKYYQETWYIYSLVIVKFVKYLLNICRIFFIQKENQNDVTAAFCFLCWNSTNALLDTCTCLFAILARFIAELGNHIGKICSWAYNDCSWKHCWEVFANLFWFQTFYYVPFCCLSKFYLIFLCENNTKGITVK